MTLFRSKPWLIIFLLSLNSCQKEQEIEYSDVIAVNSTIDYFARGTKYLDDNGNMVFSTTYQADAVFRNSRKSNATFENVGTLDIGMLQLNFDPISKKYAFTTAQTTDPVNDENFGSVTRFGISGGGSYAPVSVSLNLPEEIYIDTVSSDITGSYPRISKSNLPYRIRWNKDSTNKGTVGIAIGYPAYFGKTKYPQYVQRNSFDVGYFDINADFIKDITTNDTIHIIVWKGESTLIKSNDKTIYIQASSISEKKFILTP